MATIAPPAPRTTTPRTTTTPAIIVEPTEPTTVEPAVATIEPSRHPSSGDAEDARRFQLYRMAMVVSAPIIAAIVGIGFYVTGFTHGEGSIALGLFTAFWTTPLIAGVAACGVYGAQEGH